MYTSAYLEQAVSEVVRQQEWETSESVQPEACQHGGVGRENLVLHAVSLSLLLSVLEPSAPLNPMSILLKGDIVNMNSLLQMQTGDDELLISVVKYVIKQDLVYADDYP